MRALMLLKQADFKDVKEDVKDGYYTMTQYGSIPAFVLGTIGAYKAKGLKNKAIHGMAGIGAGFAGTFAGKTALDLYKDYKAKKDMEQQQIMQALQDVQ